MQAPGRALAVGSASCSLIPPVSVPSMSGVRPMSKPHRAVRPQWTCARDGYPWPCLDARRAMRATFGDDYSGLQRHLVRLLIVAEGELVGVPLRDLYRRFVAWALAPGEKCRVCGSPNH